jgi:hypothetical protein
MEKQEDLLCILLEEGRPPLPLPTPAAAAGVSGHDEADASTCEKRDRALKTALRVRTC